MSLINSLESGMFPIELREAIRLLLSLQHQPYLDLPSTADGPSICIGSSLADIRRYIESQHQERVNTQPRVPANYQCGRRRLPDGYAVTQPRYRDASTQTLPITPSPTRHHSPLYPPSDSSLVRQVESAPEARSIRRRKPRRLVTRTILYSSSSEGETVHSTPVYTRPVSHGMLPSYPPPLTSTLY